MPTPTIAQQIVCIQRELTMRYRVYPGLVRKGTMTPDAMAHELACMQAVLERLQGADRQPSLFAQEER